MRRALLIAMGGGLALAGCMSTPVDTDGPFYPSGFSDGCRTAQAIDSSFAVEDYRDKTLFDSEPSYRTGYRAGLVQCGDATAPGSFRNLDGDLGNWNSL
ncbi:50S ribosomal protein L32 [Parvularcula bermudensis HTCC2503]|uniref:50S ribosomal protein L32 n=1 Tax=Parvularcula bermudensis (strain ATCC BAA-594 / HTCC2503 / KCTC 12087) TaxID=314260 RepID=E0TD68_PARBH|nr:hypothetical protein [Parvularcula bermudensis]ADM08727.1 50S ribosomal protein L32 [Parvularcula bermudensis HTCC2503]